MVPDYVKCSGEHTSSIVLQYGVDIVITQDTVNTILNDDDDITFVGSVDDYVVVIYRFQKWFETRKKSVLTDGFVAHNVHLDKLKKFTKNVTWEFEASRVLGIPEEPDFLDDHVTYMMNGKYNQRPATKYCLDQLLYSMKSSSKKRGHVFVEADVLKKVNEALERCDGTCGCPRCVRNNTILNLQTYGSNAISFDRLYDYLGYGDEDQVLTCVSKRHNVSIKHGSVPKPRAIGQNWLSTTSHHAYNSFTKRMTTLMRNKTVDQMTEREREQVALYESKIPKEWKKEIRETLAELSSTTPKCSKDDCDNVLHYGDSKGILRTKNNPLQASPDRLDNSDPFYSIANTQMVCCGCQTSDKEYQRTHSEIPVTKMEDIAFNKTKWLNEMKKRVIPVVTVQKRKIDDVFNPYESD
jgi:hypothetical protein